MVRLVLFDIDGTLVRTGGAGVRAFRRVFETEFGVSDGFERLKFAGRTDSALVREFFSFHQIGHTPENLERFFDRYVFWLDHMLADIQSGVCEGILEFMADLQSLPEPPMLGLLTGNIRLGAEIKLRHSGLWESFHIGAFADDHEERDQIAAVALERGRRVIDRSLRGEQVLVIGDTPLDIRCGRAIGAKVLAVATGGHPLEELKAHRPEWAVADVRQLAARNVVSGKNAMEHQAALVI